jgi:ADP-ribose pyrophosphatase YjhB (NUDIX family)
MNEQAKKGPSIRTVPEGDNRARLVCPDCGFIQYDNPKIVVGAVCSFDDRILLCRRAIDPRKGFWVFPAGYLELHEAITDGARREVREEAGVEVDIDALLAVYTIARISQVQIIYRARMRSPDLDPGPETTEAALFRWEDIPWHDLAFPTVRWALAHFDDVRHEAAFPTRSNPPGESADYPDRR